MQRLSAMERACTSFYSKDGLKAFVREGTDDFQLLFVPREEKIHPHLSMRKGETFVDVGANVGYYSLRTALDNSDGIKVIAIEAHPHTHAALLRNIECNGLEGIITAINKAVGDKNQDMVMYEKRSDGITMYGNSSVCIAFDGEEYIHVECDTLDNILEGKRVDVLKMDIEGAEVMALAGATRVLEELRKIVVEVHGDNLEPVKSILKERGFEIQEIPYELNKYVVGTRVTS